MKNFNVHSFLVRYDRVYNHLVLNGITDPICRFIYYPYSEYITDHHLDEEEFIAQIVRVTFLEEVNSYSITVPSFLNE